MADNRIEVSQGTLGLLTLNALALLPEHGWAISGRIGRITEEARGWIKADWRLSENSRRAKYYKLSVSILGLHMLAIRTVIATLAVIAVGQLAGMLLGTGMDQYTQRNLPDINWTAQHQAMDALFSRVMPVCFNFTALLLIGTAVLAKRAGALAVCGIRRADSSQHYHHCGGGGSHQPHSGRVPAHCHFVLSSQCVSVRVAGWQGSEKGGQTPIPLRRNNCEWGCVRCKIESVPFFRSLR